MTQAKGSKGRMVIDFETTFGSDPASPNGRALPFNTNNISGSQAKNSPATITGNRNPVKPFAGNIDAGGALVVPVDTTAFYYWLYAMFGAPTITLTDSQALDEAAARNAGGGLVGIPCTAHGYAFNITDGQTLDNAAASDEGGGLVGIPCTGHGYTSGDTIYLSGTTNYNGEYTVNAATSENEIVIEATYVAETFAGTELVGEAGSGDTIYLSGTTNYDGEYTVMPETSDDEIVITATYAAETFAATDLVGEAPYAYEFKVGDSMPSMVIEKGFTDLGLYWKYNGQKIGSVSMSIGGDGELVANLNLIGAKENTPGSTPYDASVTTVSLNRLGNFQAAVKEGGASTSDCTTFDMTIDFGLDGDQRVIGGGGMRGDVPEGIISVEVNYTSLYQNNTMVAKGAAGTETSLQLTITNGTNSLDFLFPEGEFERFQVPITGPGGVRQSSKFIGYYDNDANASSVVATLTNSISYV
jgi:hypothetical protein